MCIRDRCTERGWLRCEDPQRAALQFSSLMLHTESWVSGSTASLQGDELRAVLASSVRVFLYGYSAGGDRKLAR